MTSTMTFAPVVAPVPRPQTIGSLLTSAATPPDPVDERWLRGFSFEGRTCDPGSYSIVYACENGTATDGDPTANQSTKDNPQWSPFVVGTSRVCSAMGFESVDYEGQVLTQYGILESALIAAELWDGALAQANALPNLFLADPSGDNLGHGMGVVAALGCLEAYLASTPGGLGMIHARPELVTAWLGDFLVERQPSGVLQTHLGTIVVCDGGYSGDGPLDQYNDRLDTATQYAYATDLVTVRRQGSGPQITPGSFGQAIDRTDNTVEYRADRIVAASWAACRLASVNVALARCVIGTGS